MSTLENIFGELINSYSRQQALDDGYLIDVTDVAKEAGFKFPVAVTLAVWDQFIEWGEEDSKRNTCQDQSGRLWEVLSMLSVAIKISKSQSTIFYKLKVVPRGGKAKTAKTQILKAVIHPGDNFEPIITIMLSSED